MMGKDILFDQPLPDDVIVAMRTQYAPPQEASYWSGLESRVMAQVARTPRVSWWQVLDRWAHAELVAAAAVLVLVGALVMRANATELRVAYDAVIGPAVTETFSIPAGALGERTGADLRGAIFSDVISR
jgi:hypothetical protein